MKDQTIQERAEFLAEQGASYAEAKELIARELGRQLTAEESSVVFAVCENDH